jgi:hypothetical protein
MRQFAIAAAALAASATASIAEVDVNDYELQPIAAGKVPGESETVEGAVLVKAKE